MPRTRRRPHARPKHRSHVNHSVVVIIIRRGHRSVSVRMREWGRAGNLSECDGLAAAVLADTVSLDASSAHPAESTAFTSTWHEPVPTQAGL
jgi:hypothetical protein